MLPKRRVTGRIVLGIDPSSEKLAAVWSHEGSMRGELRSVKLIGTPAAKCATAVSWSRDLCDELFTYSTAGVFAWVEDPYVGKFLNAVLPLARTQGAVLAGCALSGAEVDNVRPADWKRITGSGNAKKEQIAAWVEEAWPQVHEQIQLCPKGIRQDFYDAAAINRHGNRVLDITPFDPLF